MTFFDVDLFRHLIALRRADGPARNGAHAAKHRVIAIICARPLS